MASAARAKQLIESLEEKVGELKEAAQTLTEATDRMSNRKHQDEEKKEPVASAAETKE